MGFSCAEPHVYLHSAGTALRAAGCDVIRSEKRTGASWKGRTELQTLMDFARKGDTVVVTRIDRLARSIADLAISCACRGFWRARDDERGGLRGDRSLADRQLRPV